MDCRIADSSPCSAWTFYGRRYRKLLPGGKAARKLGIMVAINIIVDPDWDEQRFAMVREWATSVPDVVQLTDQTPYPGTETWFSERRSLTSRDDRIFDIAHAVLPTRLPLERLYRELVTTQKVLARKHLGMRALVATLGIAAGNLARGPTNFVRMLWKFPRVFDEHRQFADHAVPSEYLMPPRRTAASALRPPDSRRRPAKTASARDRTGRWRHRLQWRRVRRTGADAAPPHAAIYGARIGKSGQAIEEDMDVFTGGGHQRPGASCVGRARDGRRDRAGPRAAATRYGARFARPRVRGVAHGGHAAQQRGLTVPGDAAGERPGQGSGSGGGPVGWRPDQVAPGGAPLVGTAPLDTALSAVAAWPSVTPRNACTSVSAAPTSPAAW